MSVHRARWPVSPRRDSGLRGPSDHRRRPLVEELEAYVLLSSFQVTSNTDNGSGATTGTLSWAIDRVDSDSSDSTSNPDTITFDVGGGGAQTIGVTGKLPPVNRPLIIDGTTEPGFSTATHIPLVRIDGSSAAQDTDGLHLYSGAADSTIKGLDVTGFGTAGYAAIEIGATGVQVVGNDIGFTTAGVAAPNGEGVEIDSSGNTIGGTTAASRDVISGNSGVGIIVTGYENSTTGNLIEGNFIGTDATGTEALPNSDGVDVSVALNTTIGGTAPGAGNVISGNAGPGIILDDENGYAGPASGNMVEGNFIGTDATGTDALGNQSIAGIVVEQGASGNTIGGTTPGAGNVIAANVGGGVLIGDPGSSGNVVEGNDIGTNGGGATGLGNTGAGVLIGSGCAADTVGGFAAGAGNVIANNQGNGVTVGSSGSNGTVDDAVLGNSIRGNTGIGIDLNDDGVTANDSEGHSGSNLFQDFPVITAATVYAGDVEIIGSLNSTPNTSFTIQFFANAAANPSGYGDGHTYLGETTVTTNGAGGVNFDETFAAPPAGQAVITATATDPNGNTSEFSEAFTATVISPLVVTNTGDSGAGSLRAAIQYADTQTGLQSITFQIPGTGVQTIQPMSALPLITTPVTIDGRSQPGYAGSPLIRLDGSLAGMDADGLDLFAGSDGSTVQGLDITDFGYFSLTSGDAGFGISIYGATGVRVVGDDIGLTTAGIAAPNGEGGVEIRGSGDTIGGTTAASRDVISGNSGDGIFVDGSSYNGPYGAANNLIEGDFIGTDPSGTTAVPNGYFGVNDFVASNTTIGGTAPGAGNVISGNTHAGIEIDGNGLLGGVTTGTLVEGNFIGTNAAGTRAIGNGNGIYIVSYVVSSTIGGIAQGAGNTIAGNADFGLWIDSHCSGALVEGNDIGTNAAAATGLGNSGDGVEIELSSASNTIGGTVAGASNVIADNGGNGVTVGDNSSDLSVGDAIEGNSIHGNTGLGIDLGDDGVTLNDSEGHSGPNLLQDFPVITSAEIASGGSFAIAGTVEGPRSTNVTVSVYADPSADPSGYGQGQIYLGSVQVSIGAGGSGTISGFTTSVALHAGEVITATTTDAAGDTSEFSQDVAIVPGPDIITPMVKVQASGFNVSRSSHQYTQTITITNTSGSAIDGPVYLELDDLPTGVTLLTPSTPAPDGDGPAVEVTSAGLGVGQSVTVTLVFSNPGNIVINYVPEVLNDPFGGTEN